MSENKNYDQKEFKESNFGIRSQSDLVHIFNVLRNKMYTNKILAVLREYSTNAMDSHIESGQPNRPIEVSLPTLTSRVLSIRDFGTGLSEDDIRNVYAMYGASTKRGSTELNGQLGFGSKAAFSYRDSYTIVSFHKGEKNTYEAYVDESGLGAISLLSTEKSSDPTGIEIRVTVEPTDVNAFNITAQALYRYFKVTPIVRNATKAIAPIRYTSKGETWGLRSAEDSRTRENLVIMGNVSYPLNPTVLADNLKQYPDWKKFEALLNTPVDFFVPVGACNIAASREALEYDKKTLRALHDMFQKAVTEIVEKFNSQLAAATDIVEVKKLYKQMTNGDLRPILHAVLSGTSSLTWNGRNINSYKFAVAGLWHDVVVPAPSPVNGETVPVPVVDEMPGVTTEGETSPALTVPAVRPTVTAAASSTERVESFTVKTFQPYRNQHGFVQEGVRYGGTFEVNDEHKLVIQDTGDKPVQRLRAMLRDNPSLKAITVFKPSEHATAAAIIEAQGIDAKHFINLSTIEPLPVEAATRTGPVNPKHSRKIFRMAPVGSRTADSTYWEAATVSSEDQLLYIPLDRFVPQVNNRNMYNSEFESVITELESVTGQTFRNRIVGVKSGSMDKVGTNWRPLHVAIQEAFTQYVAANTTLPIREFVVNSKQNEDVFTVPSAFSIGPAGLIESSRLGNFLSTYRPIITETANRPAAINRITSLRNLARRFNISVDIIDRQINAITATLDREITGIYQMYPLLFNLQVNRWGSNRFSNGQIHAAALDYVRLIDNRNLAATVPAVVTLGS
jgi:hypothetical protein